MTTFVLDTGALSLFCVADERVKRFVDRIDTGRDDGILSSVTLCEFYYNTCQSLGREVATLLSVQPGERMFVMETNNAISLAAGSEKCENSRLSIADAHALALTKHVDGTLLTTDRELARSKDCKVRFFEV